MKRYRLILTGPGVIGLVPRSWRTFVRWCSDGDASSAVSILSFWGIESRVETTD